MCLSPFALDSQLAKLSSSEIDIEVFPVPVAFQISFYYSVVNRKQPVRHSRSLTPKIYIRALII